MQKRRFALSLLLLFLSGCAQTGSFVLQQQEQPEIVFSQWYLRGVFNWWEAKPAYQLKQKNDRWYVDVELIADGQPYDFKFSNVNWTTDQTCGASYKGLAISLKQSMSMLCGANAENMRFTPPRTATYRFAVKGSPNSSLMLSITAL
ncbi:hypothetical protein [Alteromonas lipolytica]|uniref:Pullulanase n=1 Tax=Alteromonas lipolytica TaxID=1856405 RepID=A0A1E8FBJ4_9ALTE|nr:hypothetical protein [Alteromonas lipolytica]OFI32873.1 hypothetical protein BFC17_00940 [Alteromonas lipolytica]GGF64560.1 hypothetical protein GCM10011338_16210 [Alteromonas lipolytica]